VYYALCRLESDAPDDAKGCFYASANQIARHSGLSLRSVQGLIPALSKSGLASVISGRGSGAKGAHVANRYTLLPIHLPYAVNAHTSCEGGAYALTQSQQEISADKKEPSKEHEELEKRIKRMEKKASMPSIPTVLDTPAFRVAWDEWIQHRKEKGKPLTPSTASKQLKEVSALGEVRAIAAIDYSILKGWLGIFENTNLAPVQEQIVPSITKTAAPDGWEETLKNLDPNATDMPWERLMQFHPEVADEVLDAIAHPSNNTPLIAQNTP
jgi:hypothetical protein